MSEGRRPMQMQDQNPYLFSCEDTVYLPAPSTKARYKRVDAVRASEIEVLPFKYLRKSDQLYYVAFTDVGLDENEYSLRVVDGVDLATMEIVDERRIRDKNNTYTVLRDHFVVEPRTDT